MSKQESAQGAAIDIRTAIETITDQFTQPGEKYLRDLNDQLVQLFTEAMETVKPQKLDDQGTQVGKGWNMCVDEFDKRFAGLVGKS